MLLTDKEDIPPAVYRVMREHMKVEPTSATVQSGKGKVMASGGLNLRDTPSAAGKLLLTIPEGATLDIADAQGNWYQTTYQNKKGWVSADYVSIVTVYKQGRITASGGLNLRADQSTSAEILETIPEGATVTLSEDRGEWYKVTHRGTSGWIFAEYVSLLPASTGTDPATTDLSPNGKVYILGGTGVISANAKNIIEGKAASRHPDNLKDFPTLPSSLDPADPQTYDPAAEVLVDPFAGIPAQALQGKKIVIDPGHGGADTGAIGPNGAYEKDSNLAIALYLNDILAEAGASVSLTRSTDIRLGTTERADLETRVDITNRNQPDLFISIHHNANTNPDKNGTTTYYSNENPKTSACTRLADAIQNSMVQTLRTVDDGVREANYYVVRYAAVPAALIEVAYISNPQEEERQQNPIFQKNAASAIFQGIYAYFN